MILEVFCGLLLFQGLAVLLFGIDTENRPLEELAPEAVQQGHIVAGMAHPGVLDR